MKRKRVLASLLAFSLLAGCVAQNNEPVLSDGEDSSIMVDSGEILADELVAMAGEPAIPNILMPDAPGTLTKKSNRSIIDYSNNKDGYVMVQYTEEPKTRLKVKVIGPSTEFAYDLTAKQWTTYPLVDGNGTYSVKLYEQLANSGKYAVVSSVEFRVELADEFAPFLRPNQYVNYEVKAEKALAKAEELTIGLEDPIEKVEKIYDYVTNNLTYDKEQAASVQSGYLPVLDDIIEKGKGICFDYAALMTAMLRSQGVPCKLVTGYVGGGAYHAWISVWTEETGWVDGAIYFDGADWQRMDPTFASSAHGSESILEYIGDGSNYSVKHFY